MISSPTRKIIQKHEAREWRMKLFLILLSLTLGTMAVIKTAAMLDQATEVMAQATSH